MKNIISIFGFAALTSILSPAFGQTNAPAWINDGLVAYYPFYGDASDASGNNHDGVVSGGLVFTNQGGNYLASFNGTDSYITVTNMPAMNSLPLTCSAWVMPFERGDHNSGGLLPGQYPNNILSDDNPGSLGQGFGLNVSPGGSSLTTEYHDGFRFSGNNFFTTNTWYHIVSVYTNGSVATFVNGVLSDGFSFSQGALAGTTTLRIGLHNTDTADYGTRVFFYGLLKNVRLYGVALSPDQVTQLYAFEDGQAIAPVSATMVMTNGFCIGVDLISGGNGYTNTPVVSIVGGGGSGAQGVAVVSYGVVTAINIVNAGSGYTTTPQIIIEPPSIIQPQVAISAASLLTFGNLNPSNEYQLQQLDGGTWSNTGDLFSATGTSHSTFASGIVGSNNFRLLAAPLPVTAQASATISHGFCVAADIINGGSGYTSAPAVTITGVGGSGATATATINGGSVTAIDMISAGSGYTTAPDIAISSPPVNGVNPAISPGMQLTINSLMINQRSQIQQTQALNTPWSNIGSGYFVSTNSVQSQFFVPTNGSSFFRLQYIR